MARTTHETLLISAMINAADAHAGRMYGIAPANLIGYRDEYEWVLSYYEQYGTCPSATELTTIFPEFPHTPDQHEARWPAHEVKRAHAARQLTRAIMKASQDLPKGQVEAAYEHFVDLRLETTSEVPRNVLVDHEYLDDYEHTDEVRVPMPWNTLQGLTNGIGPGELWYLGARQGQGKTTMLLDIAAQAVTAGHSVLIYSLEMTKRQIQVKMHTDLGRRLGMRVDHHAMLHRSFDRLEYKRLIQAIEEKVPGHLHIHEAAMGTVTPGSVAARAGDYDLVLIDYIGLMRSDDGTPAIKDYRVMAEISNQLKEIALAKQARIISPSQINREGDTYGLRPPRLKNLAQSDHLGNDGDVVLTMKRHGDGATVFSVEKNRHGSSFNLFFTAYEANAGDFREITRDVADDIKEASNDD